MGWRTATGVWIKLLIVFRLCSKAPVTASTDVVVDVAC